MLVHKKKKKLIKNNRPINLPPVFGIFYEKLIFNSIFNYFITSNLNAKSQSGFLRGDTCISQLLSITPEIHKSFGCNPALDVRGTFLDISKAFDIFKYKHML